MQTVLVQGLGPVDDLEERIREHRRVVPVDPDRVGPVHGHVTALVDGVLVTGDPRDIPIGAHDVIQLAVRPVEPFHPYAFAPGL